MKSVYKYALLVCLALGSLVAIRATVHGSLRNVAFSPATKSVLIASTQELPHSSNSTQLSPAKDPQFAQRPDVPSTPFVTSHRFSLHIDFVFFPVDPLFNDFTLEGIYHRYRPRDPTAS